MLQLHPDLLKACAAYIMHEDAYALDSDGQMSLLRADARAELKGTDRDMDAVCDALTRAHRAAIQQLAQRTSWRRLNDGVGVRAVAGAILDATPNMLAWWCGELAQ